MRTLRLDGGGLPLPDRTGTPRRPFASLAQRWHERSQRRAAAAALSHLNDHLLKEIGLSRADVMSVRDLG